MYPTKDEVIIVNPRKPYTISIPDQAQLGFWIENLTDIDGYPKHHSLVMFLKELQDAAKNED
jgi:hypothetical protein